MNNVMSCGDHVFDKMDALSIVILAVVGFVSFAVLLKWLGAFGDRKLDSSIQRSSNRVTVRIFFATQTGNARQFAESLSSDLSTRPAFDCHVIDLKDCSDPEDTLTQAVRKHDETKLVSVL